jgi:hypothetical protein
MSQRYWLVQADGGRQLIDPRQFDLSALAEVARRLGGRLEVEESPAHHTGAPSATRTVPLTSVPRGYEPPLPALGPMFQARLERVFRPQVPFTVDMNSRPTTRVLGGYYKRRRLVRIYTHDTVSGRRPLEDLFDTFLHEVAHHLEYTEPESFLAPGCGRVPGRMHSPLFWRILGELKRRWKLVQRPGETLRPIDLE